MVKKKELSLKETLIPEFNLSPAAGQALVRDWKRKKKPSNFANTILPGNMVFISSYTATTVKSWDENPVVLILRVSNKHVLAFNINWLTKREKERMIRQFIKGHVGKKGRPLNRLERLALFNKIRKFKFPKAAYRVYFKKQLKRTKIYNLTMGDFFQAIAHKMIDKQKIR